MDSLMLLVPVIIIFGIIGMLVVKPRFFSKKCHSRVCLVGKTALVTGGSLGIGYEIVLGLAQRGCKVIIADKVINNDIKNQIMLETNNPEIYMEYVDLGSFHSVRALAEKLKSREKRLDIFIHNAGIGQCGGAESEDGLNLTMQINYYSPFLLTHLLIDLLKNSPSARLLFCSSPIVLSSSNMAIYGKSLDKVFGDYRLSKFCLLVVADIFAEKLKCHNISSNCYHPGAVNTQLLQQFFSNSITQYLIRLLAYWVFKSPEDGAQTPIYLACANEVQNVTGKFFADFIPICKPNDLQNTRLSETIWDGTEKIVKLRKEELL